MLDRIKALLKEYCEDGVEITEDSVLTDELGLSSLDLIDLAAGFEDEFGIEIPDRELPSTRTVGDILRFLEKNA